jgi:type I restriction enzyme S subunit
MEGFFYNPIAARVEKWARGFGEQCADLGTIADVYDVPPFKHIYVEPGYGIPFFTSGELFDLNRTANKYLSKTRTTNLRRYILQRDWVLLARSGQLGGIIGRPQYADSGLDSTTTSDHVIRLVPKYVLGGYLFAYLYHPSIGYPLITRTMTGHSIPALWPSQLKSLPVVLTAAEKMKAIADLVMAAFEDRVQATMLEKQARVIVESAVEGEED